MVLHQQGGAFELEERPIPRPGPDEALVKIRACGAGLTVHHAKVGTSPATVPVIMGHEIAGEIVELGGPDARLAPGDRVTPHFYLFCGSCRYCLTMREPLCENTRGYVGRQSDGGYAEYVALPRRNLIRIPDALPYDVHPEQVAVICDAIATPYKVVRRARIRPAEDVLVIGAAGGVGVHMVQMAHFAGARVIAADRGAEKLAFARAAGAHDGIDASAVAIDEAARELTHGRGADVVIDFVSAPLTLTAGVASLAPGGRLLILGVHGGSRFEVDPLRMLNGELEILGSRYVTRQDIVNSLELVARGAIRPIVTRTYALEDAEQAHADVGAARTLGRVALVMQ